MELRKLHLLAFLGAVALVMSGLNASAETINIGGEAGWVQAKEYYVSIGGPGLAVSVASCDAPETQRWLGPVTFSAGAGSPGCIAGSAFYESFSWSASYPEGVSAGITGTPSQCGSYDGHA
jgi:hypothetical protein